VTRLAIILALLCGTASATTYYVDPAGSNANDGLSPATPWRTLLKVGISSFQPALDAESRNLRFPFFDFNGANANNYTQGFVSLTGTL